MILLVLAGFLIIILVIIRFIIGFINWKESTIKEYPQIKFNAFKKFYEINPDRWKVGQSFILDNHVSCYMTRRSNSMLSTGYYQFRFGLIDYYRYKLWLKHIDKQKTKLNNMQLMADMIAAVKQDIANMENLAQQQKKQAVDNITSILNNL